MKATRSKIQNNKVELVSTERLALIDYDKAKDQILTELALSTEFKNKLRKIIVNHQIGALAANYDDIYQEVFIELMKKDSEYIFNQYVKNPNNILALSLTIAKTFFKVKKDYPDYPNKSIVHKLNFASTITGQATYVSPTDMNYEFGEDSVEGVMVLDDEGEANNKLLEFLDTREDMEDAIDVIRRNLTDKENVKLNTLINKLCWRKNINTATAYYKGIIDKNTELLEKMRSILENKGLELISDLEQ